MYRLTSQLTKKRGTSYVLYAIALVGIVGLALMFVKVYLPETGREILDKIEDSQLNVVSGEITETDALLTEISSIDEAIIELQSLGCIIVNTTAYESSAGGIAFTVEYPEFRKVAVNQKIIFLYSYSQHEYNQKTSILTTSFENIYVGFMVTERINVEEEIIEESDYFEKVEIQSGVCSVDASGNWTVAMSLKNSGTATATLISIFINDVEIDLYDTVATAGLWTSDMTATYSLTNGQSGTINVYISSGKAAYRLSSGTTINIKLHSAGGMDYIKLIELV